MAGNDSDLTTVTGNAQVATSFRRKTPEPVMNKTQSPISTVKNAGKVGSPSNNLAARPGQPSRYNSISGR